jgi:hypothetical protein
VQAGDSRAIQRIMMQVAGTMFLQSYRAGKYYNYDRDGDKIAIGAPFNIVFNSLMCVVDMPIELNIFNISLSPSMINLSRSDFARYECATLKPSDSAALPFKICEFFVTVAMISLSNKSTIWSPNWCSDD